MAAALQLNKLKQYMSVAATCIPAVLMTRDEADVYLRGVVGMKAGHVHKFMDTVWRQAARAAYIHSSHAAA